MTQSGIRRLKPAFGRSSARSAFSRNRAPKKPLCSSLFPEQGLDVPGSRPDRRVPAAAQSCGTWSRRPSSVGDDWSAAYPPALPMPAQAQAQRDVFTLSAPERMQHDLFQAALATCGSSMCSITRWCRCGSLLPVASFWSLRRRSVRLRRIPPCSAARCSSRLNRRPTELAVGMLEEKADPLGQDENRGAAPRPSRTGSADRRLLTGSDLHRVVRYPR